ncbi:Aldo/keto reductase subgroup [Penicillium concentricum]|uniref:Aldo/keto reductase subgroup n=1 Tax=Penicillium concentricum TaxID=293559 RepID=A0A9W9SV90_9EURO|nr:Aldo/keto reductase subgroup [Penicillium concentricum]KAJ5383143.1 Aldo/keto reductase subgroup [Penicillium concentricum]
MNIRGRKQIQVPSPAFGTFTLEGWSPTGDPQKTIQIIRTAIHAGCRHLDCAWEYNVDAEVGEALRQSGVPRKEIFVTHKLWVNFGAPQNVEVALDLALQRIGIDYVDLFLVHYPVAVKPAGDLRKAWISEATTIADQGCAADEKGNIIPDLEHCPTSVAALNGAVGVSNFDVEHVQEILDAQSDSDDEVPLSCNQIECHPWFPNQRLVEFLLEHNILVMAYSPFASVKYEYGVFPPEPFMPYGTTLLGDETVQQISAKNGMSASQVLLSWAAQRSTLPVSRSRSSQHQQENLLWKELPQEDVQTLATLELDGAIGKSTATIYFPGIKVYNL